jgi:cation diffusion facilitator family transporter
VTGARGDAVSLGTRRPTALTRAGRDAGNRRSIAFAFAANVVVAAAKLAAGLLTGSAALLAEAVHSTADSVNEALLALALRRGSRPPDAVHPLGYGGERFLWAFVAAIASFVIGGCLSIALAGRELVEGARVDRFVVAWIVLGVSAVADCSSLVQGLARARREAGAWGQSTATYLRYTSEPTLRAIVVEDAAALAGVALAAGGLAVHALGGPPAADAVASLLIGLLLTATAVGLARPLADLLIRKSIAPARLERARAIVAGTPGVEEILSMYAVYAAPQEAILAARIHPSPGQTGDGLAELLDRLDERLRSELPEISAVFIDVTARHGSGEAARPGTRHPTDASTGPCADASVRP